MDVTKLLAKMQGMDAEQQAKAITQYVVRSMRSKTIADGRKEIRNKLFANCKNLTKEQQISFIYEFLSENHSYFNQQWLNKKHSELFDK